MSHGILVNVSTNRYTFPRVYIFIVRYFSKHGLVSLALMGRADIRIDTVELNRRFDVTDTLNSTRPDGRG